MKKILFTLMAFSLVFALAIPCFANYEDYYATDVHDLIRTYGLPTDYILVDSYGEAYVLSGKPYLSYSNYVTFNITDDFLPDNSGYVHFVYNSADGVWDFEDYYPNAINISLQSLVYSSTDIKKGNDVVFAHDPYFWGEPLTLNQQVNNVVSDTLSNDTVPYLSNVLVILTGVGVGLIALFALVALLRRKDILHL